MSLVNMDEMLDDVDVGSGSGSDGNFSFDSIDIVDSDILADMDDILHELEDMETVPATPHNVNLEYAPLPSCDEFLLVFFIAVGGYIAAMYLVVALIELYRSYRN